MWTFLWRVNRVCILSYVQIGVGSDAFECMCKLIGSGSATVSAIGMWCACSGMQHLIGRKHSSALSDKKLQC